MITAELCCITPLKKTQYGPDGLTCIQKYKGEPFVIVEEFFDYYQHLAFHSESKYNYIVLNSGKNLPDLIDILSRETKKRVYLSLKDDLLGKIIIRLLQEDNRTKLFETTKIDFYKRDKDDIHQEYFSDEDQEFDSLKQRKLF